MFIVDKLYLSLKVKHLPAVKKYKWKTTLPRMVTITLTLKEE